MPFASACATLGIRMAVGASPGHIARMVLGQAFQIVGTGCIAGLIGALGVGRLMAGMLFGISTDDPVALCVMAILLTAVRAGAAYLPARWAMHVDPMLSIRAE